MKSETLEVLIPAELAPLVFLCGCQGRPFGVEKSPKNLYERYRWSCELLEHLPFKQWFSYFFDCWVPEKSLQILISGIFVAKNDGNVHLDGSWINILIMLCDLGKKHSRLPSLQLQVYPLKLMVGFSEISFGLFSGAKMSVSGRVCVSTRVIFDELNVSEGSKHVDPSQFLPSHRRSGTSLNQPLKRSLIQMFRVYLFKSTISTTFMWIFPKIGGKPPKWMVKITENPNKIDDLGGKPTIFGNTPCFYSPTSYSKRQPVNPVTCPGFFSFHPNGELRPRTMVELVGGTRPVAACFFCFHRKNSRRFFKT